MTQIKKPFGEKIKMAEELLNQFKAELGRTTTCYYNNKAYRATRRARLNRLRLELHEVLIDIERNYPILINEEVK